MRDYEHVLITAHTVDKVVDSRVRIVEEQHVFTFTAHAHALLRFPSRHSLSPLLRCAQQCAAGQWAHYPPTAVGVCATV